MEKSKEASKDVEVVVISLSRELAGVDRDWGLELGVLGRMGVIEIGA